MRLLTVVMHVIRQEGIAYEVLQWYICRMEAWFAADADMISLKAWDQASFFPFYVISCELLLLHSYQFELSENNNVVEVVYVLDGNINFLCITMKFIEETFNSCLDNFTSKM